MPNISGQKKVYPSAYCRSISWHALEQAKAKEKGAHLGCAISMLFSAFFIEGVLNCIGRKRIAIWEQIETKLNPRQKMALLAWTLGYALDYGKEPLTSFKPIFQFRNLMAHNKPEEIPIDQHSIQAEQGYWSLPQAKWEQMISEETAQRFCDDSLAIAKTLLRSAGMGDGSIYSSEIAAWLEVPEEQDRTPPEG